MVASYERYAHTYGNDTEILRRYEMEKLRSKMISNKLLLSYYKESEGFFINFMIRADTINTKGEEISFAVRKSISKIELECCRLDLSKETQFGLLLSMRNMLNRNLRNDL